MLWLRRRWWKRCDPRAFFKQPRRFRFTSTRLRSKIRFETKNFLLIWCCFFFPISGEPILYDRKFKGPKSRRSCTDIAFLLFFLAAIGCWAYVGHYCGYHNMRLRKVVCYIYFLITAFKNGDLDKLLKPTDSLNRKCGIDSSVSKEPYLFFFDLGKCIDPLVPITGCPTPQVCVKQCPSESFFYENEKGKSFEELRRKLVCFPDIKLNNKYDIETAIQNNQCASWYIPSKPCKFQSYVSLCFFLHVLLY